MEFYFVCLCSRRTRCFLIISDFYYHESGFIIYFKVLSSLDIKRYHISWQFQFLMLLMLQSEELGLLTRWGKSEFDKNKFTDLLHWPLGWPPCVVVCIWRSGKGRACSVLWSFNKRSISSFQPNVSVNYTKCYRMGSACLFLHNLCTCNNLTMF